MNIHFSFSKERQRQGQGVENSNTLFISLNRNDICKSVKIDLKMKKTFYFFYRA